MFGSSKARRYARTSTIQMLYIAMTAKLSTERLEDRLLLAGGAELVKDINSVPSDSTFAPTEMVGVGNVLYFTAPTPTAGKELWKSNGTEAGTVRVKDIRLGSNSSYPVILTNVNGTLYFSADDDVSGREPWKSDGTEAGTVRVKDVQPGSGGSNLSDLTNVNGTLFFHGN